MSYETILPYKVIATTINKHHHSPEDANESTFSVLDVLCISAQEHRLHDSGQMLWLTVSEDVQSNEVRGEKENVGKDELCHEVGFAGDVNVSTLGGSDERRAIVRTSKEHRL